MSGYEAPPEGEYVRIEFDGDESPIKGRVEEVDMDPDGPGNEIYFGVDNGESATIQVFAGEYDGEDDAAVIRYSEFSGSHNLGNNATWSVME